MKRGKYILEGVLYEGSSEVYLGRHEEMMHKKAAIKIGKENMLRLEAQILQELQHPNVINILDADFGEEPYLALEYGEKTLRDIIPCHWEEAIEYMRQTLEGLAHAHSKGIIHRDIKPDNLILINGKVKIADWDIATAEHIADPELSNTLKTIKTEYNGTPGYMSPEQLDGKEATEKTDVHAAGITLYEMITGERPSINYKKASNSVKCPEWIDEIIETMLASDTKKTKEIMAKYKSGDNPTQKKDYTALAYLGMAAGTIAMTFTLVAAIYTRCESKETPVEGLTVQYEEGAKQIYLSTLNQLEQDLEQERQELGSTREDGTIRTTELDYIYKAAIEIIADEMTGSSPNKVTLHEVRIFTDNYKTLKEYLEEGGEIDGYSHITDILDKAYDGLERLFQSPEEE